LTKLIEVYASLEELKKHEEDELEWDELVDKLFVIYNTIIKVRTLLSQLWEPHWIFYFRISKMWKSF
jgi:hypothetical protein